MEAPRLALPALLALLALPALLAGPARAASAAEARERPRCRAHTACRETSISSDEIFYSVNGVQLIMEFEDTKTLLVWCNSAGSDGAVAADEPALPALERPVRVDRAEFCGCLPPARPGGSYVAALAALNVTATGSLVLTQQPPAPPLARAHLAGLRVHTLTVKGSTLDPLQPEHDFLSDVQNLRALTLSDVALNAATLLALPSALQKLSLSNARLPAAERGAPGWLARLRALRSLALVEQGAARARLAPPPVAALPNLTELYLRGGMAPPPPGWLHDSSLKTLALDSCGLTELPSDIFRRVNLTSLSLLGNNLTDLPGGVFSDLRWLSSLNLSANKLDGAALARALPPLERLEELRAAANPLGSLCGGAGDLRGREPSVLRKLPALRRLELGGTGAARVCADWVDESALQYIDLRNNRIEYLYYEDVAMERRAPAGAVRLLLGGNPLRDLLLTTTDLADCQKAGSSVEENSKMRVQVEVRLDALACDCRHAWLRAALRGCASLLAVRDAEGADVPCASPPAAPAGPARANLLDYEPDELLCPYKEDCIPGCECGKRARDNATVVRCSGPLGAGARWPAAAPRWPLALHVPGAGLRAAPRVEPRGALVELHAANNSIESLDHEDIPDSLQVLDVSYNSISHISEAAALRLARGAGPRHVLLRGNPLACDCAHRAALVHLKFAKTLVADWDEVRCADLRYVRALDVNELCRSVLLPALLGVLGALLVFLLAALLLRRLRPRIKQYIADHLPERLHWVLGATDAADDPNKTHDVFISYAYPDHALATRLVRRLEARGHTTVEHCRDWLPGAAVSEHIARSVLCARRTLLLVSDNFANSKWGLDEFRVAHAHALERGSARVLVVRCGLRAPHLLPPDLQLYLYNNTYLSWDDPAFWDKLWRVMPPLRLAAKAEAAPPVDTEPPLSAQVVLSPPSPRAAPAEPDEIIPAAPPEPAAASKEPALSAQVVLSPPPPRAAPPEPAAASKEPALSARAEPTPPAPASRACKKAPLFPTQCSLAPRAAPAAC